jgi:hypothetical protein
MPLQPILDVVMALVLVTLLAWRQLRWRRFDPDRALRLPIVLGGAGLVVLWRGGGTVTTLDLAFLLLELVVSIGVGLAMGSLLRFRPGPEGELEVRAGWIGAALWLVLLAARIGLDIVASAEGAPLLASVGVVLVMIGVTRAVSAVVARGRAPRSTRSLGMIDA